MMRLKIFSLFVAVQVLSFGLWNTLSPADVQAVSGDGALVHPAPQALSSEHETDAVQANLHFSTRNMDYKRRFLNAIKENQIRTALQKLPKEHVASVESITLDYNENAHRGLGGNSMIILRVVNMGTAELIGVLVHELGHNVDYGYLTPENTQNPSSFKDGDMTLYESDPSVDFYKISWNSNHERKKTASNMDFVSGYAMSDPFEDFGETYAFYVLHNRDFKIMAASSDALLAKYRFMKYVVFDGLEFDTGDGEVHITNRPWDITVLGYNVAEFLS